MKLLSTFFIFLFALPLIAGDFSLRPLSDGTAEISAYTGSSSDLTVPEKIDGKKIIAVGAHAFFGNENLRSIILPEGVTAINTLAFAHCSKLERVRFPKSLRKIDARAFFACGKLSSIELPDLLTSIGDEAFAFCSSLKNISAPPQIFAFGENVFPLDAPGLFPPNRFPMIEIDPATIRLQDPSGNQAIDGNELCTLCIPVKNTGNTDAYGCRLRVSLKTPNSALTFSKATGITKIPAGKTVTVALPIFASRALDKGNAEFSMYVEEPNQFDSEEGILALETRPFVAPALKIVDFAVSGQGDSTLKKNAPFDLQLFLQNTTVGRAEDVVFELVLPSGIILTDGEEKQRFASLKGGETKPLEFSLLVPRRYRGSEIPVKVKISERYGDYAENWSTTLKLNTAIAANKTTIKAGASEASDKIEIFSFTSEVDKNIPENPENRSRNIFVAIVANEKYRFVEPVAFAQNDGKIFYEYCRKTLGVPERQIKFFRDATGGELNEALSWLETRGKLPNAELIFYYSGHGVPDDATRTAYLLPTDVSPSNLGYVKPLSEIYEQLAYSRAKFVSVFLDACFSGMRRDNAPIVAAKAVRLAVRNGDLSRLPPNLVVFTAASGDQTAHFAKDEKHGLFTYVLLKKLQETRGNISFAELGKYLKDTVFEQSLKLNDFAQTPSVLSHDSFSHWDEKLYVPEEETK